MAETPQTYRNHVRWHTPFHFILAPLLLLNLIFAAVQLYRFRDLDHAAWLVLAVALFIIGALTRTNPLRVQDRLIRLEERLRYRQVLPAPRASKRRGFDARAGRGAAFRFG